MTSMDNLKTTKNKPCFLVDGYVFIKNKYHNDVTYWVCTNNRQKLCKARINTKGDVIIKKVGEHNHAGNAANVGVRKTLTEIKKRALSTNINTQHIIAESTVAINNPVRVHMPSIPSMQRTIHRQRQGNAVIPKSLIDLIIQEKFNVTLQGDPFLLYDSGPTETRILIFSTQRNLHFLAQSDMWFVDGTFKTVPLIFNQLFTIHGVKEKQSLPLVYVLLPNKLTESYKSSFEQLKLLNVNLKPLHLMSDFEQAIINAVSVSFPDAQQKFCFFHLGQSLYRKICQVGLKAQYDQDAAFAHKIRMILSVAFVPPADVINAFQSLTEINVIPEEANEILDYFEDNYIGRFDVRSKNETGRRNPRYCIESWNVYTATLEDSARTNNCVEGWHNGFSRLVGCEHPSVDFFLFLKNFN